MDWYTAIEFAKQRMKEIGKRTGDYHIKSVIVVGTLEQRSARRIVIQARNEYYILVNYGKLSGLEILSDTGYFNSDDYTNNTNTQEFTGEIIITQLKGKNWSIDTKTDTGVLEQFPINFIKVIF